jgi:formate dehydrogenase subunit gamma
MSKSETVSAGMIGVDKPSEDYISGEVVVRHATVVRVAHWWVALFFILAFLSGAALYSPRFFFLSNLFGGGYTARQLHPWFSILFALGFLVLFFRWAGQMKWSAADTRWMSQFKRYLRHEEISDVGKFNAGQKLFFWAVALGGLLLLVTGIIMWYPTSFPLWLRYLSYPIHEILFILFALGIIYHLYITLFALGGTLRAMTRGTVTKAWAKGHHPRWFDEANRK